MTRTVKDPYIGALLGLAWGDALGDPVEFLNRRRSKSTMAA